MDRVIKFRGRRVDNREWVYGYYTHTNKIMNPCIHVDLVKVYEVDPSTVGQFTGLHDKDGKEIWENDWCEAMFRDRDGFHVKQGVILMDEYMWCLDTKDPSDYEVVYSVNRLHLWKVISNIHDNPELLKS